MKKTLFSFFFAFTLLSNLWAQDALIGEIKMFAGNFAPRDWMYCQGQLLPIAQYQALFSIIGTTYGGDGKTNFALPNMSGRVPIGVGNGAGLSPRLLGQTGGNETVTLNVNQMPQHIHTNNATTATATTNIPSSSVVPASAQLPASGAIAAKKVNTYATASGNPIEGFTATTPSGNSQPHDNMMPFMSMNYIICVNGIYPSRP